MRCPRTACWCEVERQRFPRAHARSRGAARFARRALFVQSLLVHSLLNGCHSGSQSARVSDSQASADVYTQPAREIHIAAIALVGPLLDLTYTNYIALGEGNVDALPVPKHLATTMPPRDARWRIHIVLSISGPHEEVARISSFVHAQQVDELLVDVFDATTEKRLTPSALNRLTEIFSETASGDPRPMRSEWELTRMTNELGLRVLILPIELVQAPSRNGRVRVALDPMAKVFRASAGAEVPVVVDTRPVEFILHEP